MLRVLLIEPDACGAESFGARLERSRKNLFAVTHVMGPATAIPFLLSDDCDAIILTRLESDADTVAAIRKLQATGTRSPVVLLLEGEDEALAASAFQAGAQDCLVRSRATNTRLALRLRYAIERKQAEQSLARLALHDPLTGLGNRILFMDHLEQALERARRTERSIGVMFLDLDGFKEINDTLGHVAGDDLLRGVAERLRGCVRASDTLARLGGDEFTAVLEELEHSEAAATVARKMLDVLSRPFQVSGGYVGVGSSIGIAVFPDCGKDAESLIKYADAAMYRAKKGGGSAYRFYTTDMSRSTRDRLALEEGLRGALERGEFSLHYQPLIDLTDGRIISAEALIRWNSKNGLVSPDDFIPLAEITGLIAPIGEWVMHTACAHVQAWDDAGLPSIRVAVNVSERQFGLAQVEDTVRNALAAAKMKPERLELEVSQSLLRNDPDKARELLDTLKGLGVTVMLDDLGTGDWSVNSLWRFPLDAVKLDRSLVGNIGTEPNGAAVAGAVVSLANGLNLGIVAEGVENQLQLDCVSACGCNAVQGFIYSPPMPESDFAKLLARQAEVSSAANTLWQSQPAANSLA